MDGFDLSAIDQLDNDVFNGSHNDSDEGECDLPLPECIGIDSAVQDEEEARLSSCSKDQRVKTKSRTEQERELELRVLKPNSIRRQILEQSLNDGNNRIDSGDSNRGPTAQKGTNNSSRSHVMNITEKAGMSGIDKEKINQIIHEASKGSLFYKKQAQRQAEIHKSIEKMLNRVKSSTPAQVENARVTCDKLLDELEKKRVFNRVIVHFDLDMFFAAVEIRDNPELKDKPVAVGGDSMVSTSNYIARRFGVRAAMPGFIAKKLCPDLVLIKPNGFKYRQASSEVFSILEQYDPDLTSMSLDEAYLDLTEHVKGTLERDGLELDEYYDGTLPKIWWQRASEVVEEIRQAIFDKTQLTCSAGIACNTLLSKISTDINKPNGQFMVQGYPKDVMDFISKTSVEKVSGIGKVSAQFLNALEIKTCGDIYAKRHFLPLVFYEINVRFYLRVALGDGSTSIKSDEQRKSKSVERTFTAVKDTLILLDKLDSICEELCSRYLKPYRIRGRTITVKLKRNTFTTTTKSYSMLVPTNDKLVIYSAARNLLLSEIANEPPEISYRLLGVKLSNLADDGVTTNQLTIDAMLRNQELSKSNTKSDVTVHSVEDDESKEMSPEEREIRLALATQEELVESSSNMSVNGNMGSNSSQGHQDGGGGSQKRRLASEPTIEGFFRKKSKTSPVGDEDEPKKVDKTNEDGRFFSQEDDEEFFDTFTAGDDGNEPNELSLREQKQNEPHDEDFQCPYCFKPFSNFSRLESHVESCYLKTPFDVNKTFFSQKSQGIPKFTQSVSNSPVTLSSQAKLPASSQKSTKRTLRARRQLGTPSPSISDSLTKFKLGPIDSPKSQNLVGNSGQKPSFYQKFIESNSQSLSQALKVEPLQCPYCHHGFLNFHTLETHVMICTKQKSS